MNFFKRKKPDAAPKRKPQHLFSTHFPLDDKDVSGFDHLIERAFKVAPPTPIDRSGNVIAMDSVNGFKAAFDNFNGLIPDNLAYWYGAQSFIGYQLCAIFAQNWLVDKACTMPARDAVRTWFDLSVPEDIKVDPAQIAALKAMDDEMNLKDKLVEFIRFKNIYGIRHALFVVDSPDPDYYLNPFNIDGVKPGSYKGISQLDPYWITPELNFEAASNPASLDFYVPTWWRVNGKRIHKSHFVIAITSEVADILKPSYFYGGVSVPQKIYERVYASERTANEAPLLALTKRTTTIKTDLSLAEANKNQFLDSIKMFTDFRDNFGAKIIGIDDDLTETDTSLTDLDAAIMTQYQIVSAAANVPATKLLGTTPKGFNATGEYEEASYHEELESVQEHDLSAFVNRHHELCIKSAIAPSKPFPVQISWNPLDSPTAAELADINMKKAQTGAALAANGAIDGLDERQRLVMDKDSGYANLPAIERDIDEVQANEENDDGDGNDESKDE